MPVTQKNTQNHKKRNILLLCLLPFAAFGAALLLKAAYMRWIAPYLPPCILRTLTGYRCPSCGMTHSVNALLRGDLPESLRQNALIPAAALLLIWKYIALWASALGSEKRLFPHGKRFWLSMLAAALLYSVLRNLTG